VAGLEDPLPHDPVRAQPARALSTQTAARPRPTLDAKLTEHRRAVAVAAIALAAVVFACWGLIEVTGEFPGDGAMRPYMGANPSWLDAHRVPQWVTDGVAALTSLAGPPLALVIVVALMLIAYRAGGRRYALLPLAAAAVVFVSAGLKELFGPSPFQEATTPARFGTLPSTHTAFAAAVLGFGAWLALRQRRYAVAALIVVVIAAIGPARVLDSAHWPSDVVAGYALGLAWLLGVLLLGTTRRARST
jgi:undecaprenyl-diphosphatase